MKRTNYVSPILLESNVVIERGFEASVSTNGGFKDYVEEDFKW